MFRLIRKDCHDTKPTFDLLASDRSKAVVLVKFLLNVF